MKNVTKQDLVQEAARSSGHSQVATKEVAEHFFRIVRERLAENESIEIRGFGTFHIKYRKPRPARNPRTGEFYPLGPRRVALFRFCSEITNSIHEMPELAEALGRAQSREPRAKATAAQPSVP